MAANTTTESAEATLSMNLPVYNPINLQTWFPQFCVIFNAMKITSQKSRYT